MADVQSVDVYPPHEIAKKVEQIGVAKGTAPFYKLAILGIMAGVFVAMGAIFYFIIVSDVKGGFGVTQLLGGLVFNLGLMLCVLAGAELFTGNTLLTVAFASGKITWKQMLRNWAIVWSFNFVGGVIMAVLAYLAEHYTGGGGLVGAKALSVGATKAGLPSHIIFFRAILCNLFVCLASWMTYGARTVTDKFFAMFLPIMAFVAAGFEHSVANTFFIPYALLLKGNASVVAASGIAAEKLSHLTLAGFANNMVWATLGNIIGGGVLVGLTYWVVYLKDNSKSGGVAEKKAA